MSNKLSSTQRRAAQLAEIVREAKTNKPCVDCRVIYPAYVMDFDHVRGVKCFAISMRKNISAGPLYEEIAKCDVICANCHRERTFGHRKDLH